MYSNVVASQPTTKVIDIEPVLGDFVVQGKAHGYLTKEDNSHFCLSLNSIDIWLHPKQDQKWQLLGVRFGLAATNGPDDWKMLGKGEIYPFRFELKPNSK